MEDYFKKLLNDRLYNNLESEINVMDNIASIVIKGDYNNVNNFIRNLEEILNTNNLFEICGVISVLIPENNLTQTTIQIMKIFQEPPENKYSIYSNPVIIFIIIILLIAILIRLYNFNLNLEPIKNKNRSPYDVNI